MVLSAGMGQMVQPRSAAMVPRVEKLRDRITPLHQRPGGCYSCHSKDDKQPSSRHCRADGGEPSLGGGSGAATREHG